MASPGPDPDPGPEIRIRILSIISPDFVLVRLRSLSIFESVSES